MPTQRDESSAVPSSRVAFACRRCRQRKVKCSGLQPCSNCIRRRQVCVFDEAERKVVISESRLRELQRRASGVDTTERARIGVTSPPVPVPVPVRNLDSGEYEGARELTEGPVRGVPDYQLHPSFATAIPQLEETTHEHAPSIPAQGHSAQESDPSKNTSLWALCQEIRHTLGLPHNDVPHNKRAHQRVTYNFRSSIGNHNNSTPFDLPSKSFIGHLAQVVDFHLNTTYFFFNLPALQEEIEQAALQHLSPLQRTKVLAIVAMGKLLLEKGATTFGPPGIKEFLDATHILPSNLVLSQFSLMATETLALLAVYAQAADLHAAAYLYIGQARRLGRYGQLWKRELNPTNKAIPTLSDGQKLWCTVCLLDDTLGLVVGSSLDYQPGARDDDLVFLRTADSQPRDTTLHVQVCIVNVMRNLISASSRYVTRRVPADDFLPQITRQFVAAHELGRELSSSYQLCQSNALSTISRSVATLHLLYCQAVLRGMYPICLAAIAKYSSPNHGMMTSLSPELLPEFWKTCLNAAAHSLNIIFALREQNLIETFMFTDLEATMMAALSLKLSAKLFPGLVDPQFLGTAREVLQDMNRSGNIPAGTLLVELDEISGLIASAPGQQELSLLPQLKTPIRLTYDGHVLNCGVADIVKIDVLETCSSNSEPHRPQLPLSNALLDAIDISQENHENLKSTVDSSLELGAPTIEDNMSHGDAIFLDYFDATAIQLDSELTNSNWLDFV